MRNVWVLMLLILMAVAPTSSASALTIDVEDVPEVRPGTTDGTTTLTVTGPCGGAGADEALTLNVEDAPDWARVNLTPPLVLLDHDGCDGTWRVDVDVNVTVTMDADAFETAPVTLAARWGNLNGTARFNVTAGFVSVLDVSLARGVLQMKPGEAGPAALTIRNLGNADVMVRIAVKEAPPGWQVTEPPAIRVPRAGGGDADARTVTVMVHSFGEGLYTHVARNVALHVTSIMADAPYLVGENTSASMLVQVEGVQVPAPPLPGVAGAFAMAAVTAAARTGPPRRARR